MPTGPDAGRNTGYDDFNRHKYWHFVDMPFSQDNSDVSSVTVPTPDAETQIAVFRGVLRSNAANALKSFDLVWLLHLIGDVRQALHCATRITKAHPKGDAGGNDVGFCTAGAAACDGKLHSYWDSVLGTSALVVSADTYASGLDVPGVSDTDIADAKTWIAESSSLAETKIYIMPVVPMMVLSGRLRNTPPMQRRLLGPRWHLPVRALPPCLKLIFAHRIDFHGGYIHFIYANSLSNIMEAIERINRVRRRSSFCYARRKEPDRRL